ncbi:transcriptional regulator [Nocardia panacis]|uniref:Transcriptional regulator n=1 Tax=Nocardia panacis TaxID=2340916 RepID=A0A3A4JSB2_9NOCA|nr:winged helix-turn-helix transcriptional regulator [Nocardia panacis]RJO72524.1 transcriptional regulator [Nocardia panacis]
MGTKRYAQMCAVAASLDIVGERWTLLIIRDLMTGPKRYNQLLDETLVGIGPNLLAARLQMLTEAGIIARETVSGDRRGVSYRLTPSGEALRPVIIGLASWGLSHVASSESGGVVRAEWGRVALEAMVAVGPPPEVDEDYEFQIGSELFHVHCADGVARVVNGPVVGAAALVVTADPETFIKVGTEQLGVLDAVLSGKVVITGDTVALERCLRLLDLELTAKPAAGEVVDVS